MLDYAKKGGYPSSSRVIAFPASAPENVPESIEWPEKMEVTEQSIRQRYSEMETDELVELHRTSELTEMALSVLEEIFAERGVTREKRNNIVEQLEKESSAFIPLASTGSRFAAQTIDGVIAFPLIVVAFLAVGWGSDTGFLIGLGAYIAYLLFQDGLPNGQSIGKRVMGIRVVNRSSGKACGFGASFVRNIFLVFLGPIDLLFLASKLRQRLGDMAANTIVITVEGKVGEF